VNDRHTMTGWLSCRTAFLPLGTETSYHSAYTSTWSNAVLHPDRCAAGACEPGKSIEPS
jgi:hypothetical protein